MALGPNGPVNLTTRAQTMNDEAKAAPALVGQVEPGVGRLVPERDKERRRGYASPVVQTINVAFTAGTR